MTSNYHNQRDALRTPSGIRPCRRVERNGARVSMGWWTVSCFRHLMMLLLLLALPLESWAGLVPVMPSATATRCQNAELCPPQVPELATRRPFDATTPTLTTTAMSQQPLGCAGCCELTAETVVLTSSEATGRVDATPQWARSDLTWVLPSPSPARLERPPDLLS
jgi:hypothetical protein